MSDHSTGCRPSIPRQRTELAPSNGTTKASVPPGCRATPRPQLRIITSTEPALHRPIAVRHPALVKTAPLVYPASIENRTSLTFICSVPDASVTKAPELLLQVFPPQQPAPKRKHFRPGHRRRLSDKFKSLFSSLHIKKGDHIPFVQPDPAWMNENALRRLHPTRPHRSPGTASFLVHRHLAPDPSLPTSAHSSSTAFSTTSRPMWAEKGRMYLAPPGVEISHFSNPTTLSSAGGSGSGRSVSSGEVLERSPDGMIEGLGTDQGVLLNAKMRRYGSMPDLRKMRGMWSDSMG